MPPAAPSSTVIGPMHRACVRPTDDVSPLRGVIVTEAATSRLSVGVDVLPMDGDEAPQVSVLKLKLSS